jgi:putative transposase
MQCPVERCERSTRIYQGLPELAYPFHDKTVTVTTCGRICFNRQKINLSLVFAGRKVGVKQVSENIWLASFMDYDLGYFDDETCRPGRFWPDRSDQNDPSRNIILLNQRQTQISSHAG